MEEGYPNFELQKVNSMPKGNIRNVRNKIDLAYLDN